MSSASTPRQTPSLVEDQIEREILDEETRVVLERLLVERVQDCMAGAIGGSAGALRGAFAEMRRHAAKRALVDLAFLGARERHAVMFELDDRGNRFAAHVFDRVLIAEPVRTLDRVVKVETPVVLAHVAERGRNAALRGDRVRARRKHFREARRLQTRRGETEGRAQTRAAGTDHDDVDLVFLDLVALHRFSFRARCGWRRARSRRRRGNTGT